jgi:hypothetical protein
MLVSLNLLLDKVVEKESGGVSKMLAVSLRRQIELGSSINHVSF